ncbi:MAG: sulfotransferase [Methylovirgula sp.]
MGVLLGGRLVLRHGSEEYQQQFINEAASFAENFASRLCAERGFDAFVDSTPGNLLVAPRLVKAFPDALFILVIRQPAGVVQSLERSFESGRLWAGSNDVDRAEIWRTFYAFAPLLPIERTIILSYDLLCDEPKKTLDRFNGDLRRLFSGFAPELDAFCTAHSGGTALRILGVKTRKGVSLRRVPSFDAGRWSLCRQQATMPIVADVDALMRSHFPEHFIEPRC